jgi:hypothetical protein
MLYKTAFSKELYASTLVIYCRHPVFSATHPIWVYYLSDDLQFISLKARNQENKDYICRNFLLNQYDAKRRTK